MVAEYLGWSGYLVNNGGVHGLGLRAQPSLPVEVRPPAQAGVRLLLYFEANLQPHHTQPKQREAYKGALSVKRSR